MATEKVWSWDAPTSTWQATSTPAGPGSGGVFSNVVLIDGWSASRLHPATGATLPTYPQCVVIWTTHAAITRPPAALPMDLVFNEPV